MTFGLRQVVVAVTALLATAIAAAAFAATEAPSNEDALEEQVRRENAQCFDCHTEEGVKNPPRPGLNLEKLKQTLIDPGLYHGSNHGPVNCKECHSGGYQKFPHPPAAKQEPVACDECHASKVMKIEPQFEASVHHKNLKDKFTCSTCHDPHIALIAAKLADPRKIVKQDNQMCLDCHNSDLTFAKFAPEEKNEKKKRPDIDTIHEWLPNTKLHWQAVRCIECHTPVVKSGLSHEIVDKDKAEKKCVTCHTSDTALAARLYRHLQKDEQQKYGFANSVILSNSYVVGATRHPLIDNIVMGLVILTLLGVLGHGVVRIIAMRRRNKPQ
jgi:predicted CXXCH cytochrome family protein